MMLLLLTKNRYRVSKIWPDPRSLLFKAARDHPSNFKFSSSINRTTDDPSALPTLTFTTTTTTTTPPPSLPEGHPQNHLVKCNGFAWTDEYSWLTHRPILPEAYTALEEERLYFESVADNTGLSSLASEFKQDILSVIERAANGGEESNCALGGNKSRRTPAERVGNYEYYVLQTEDSPFPKYMRRPLRGWGLGSQKPEVVLDVNNLPSQHREIGTIKLSMCGRYVAFTATDSGLGEGTGTLMVRDITFSKHHTFRRLVQPVVDVEWAADGSLLATTVDALGRPSTVIRLHLSHSDGDSHGHDNHHSKQQGDVVIYHEPDPAYMVSLQRTKDWKYLGINAHSKLSSEIHILPALDPTLPNLRCLAPRKAGVEYVMEHHENRFYLLTNYDDDGESKRGDEGTSNYSLYYVDGASSSLGEWERVKLVLPPDIDRENLILEDMDVFKAAGLVLYGRDASKGGRPMVLVAQPHDVHLSSTSPTSSKHTPLVELHLSPLDLPEWVRSVSSGANADYNAPLLRLFLSSPTHPDVAVDVDLLTVTGKKCKPSQIQIPVLVPKSFPFPVTTVSVPCLVHTDGAPEFKSIPVTYIGGNSDSGPCLVVVYAAYGHCLPTDFVPERIALLQRGWNIALVHARGGGELGRRWHAAGRGRNKGNSALDVIAAAEHLVRLGLARRGLLALEANSAGAIAAGGALLSSSSDLFGAAILESPFVDVLTAMSDPLLPLTIHEYDEFADPSDVSPHGGDLSADGLASIAAWCPYKNAKWHGKDFTPQGQASKEELSTVEAPHVLITCSSSDDRVCFVGPLKFAARLRKRWFPGPRILVAPNLHDGHLPSDQDRVTVKSLQYAFISMALNAKKSGL